MKPSWTPVPPQELLADGLRVTCALFLSEAVAKERLDPGTKISNDLSGMRVQQVSVNRPQQDEYGYKMVNYNWYRTFPVWMNENFWIVRMDHFIPQFEGEGPISLFTVKNMYPGGIAGYLRYTFIDGVIQMRAALGWLDPLITSDINASRPTYDEFFQTFFGQTQGFNTYASADSTPASLKRERSSPMYANFGKRAKTEEGEDSVPPMKQQQQQQQPRTPHRRQQSQNFVQMTPRTPHSARQQQSLDAILMQSMDGGNGGGSGGVDVAELQKQLAEATRKADTLQSVNRLQNQQIQGLQQELKHSSPSPSPRKPKRESDA